MPDCTPEEEVGKLLHEVITRAIDTFGGEVTIKGLYSALYNAPFGGPEDNVLIYLAGEDAVLAFHRGEDVAAWRAAVEPIVMDKASVGEES